MDIARRFIFHGHACAYSGRLYRPDDITIASPASAALSVAGGLSEASAKRQKFASYLSVGKSSASARGQFDDRKRAVAMTHGRLGEDELVSSTVCSAEVHDIMMDDKRFKVKEARGSLAATSPAKGNEPPIALGKHTSIRGVSMDGYELAVTLDLKPFQKYDTFDALVKNADRKKGPFFDARDGVIYTSIVRELKWAGKAHPEAIIDRHCLYVPGFGRVYFGELFIDRASRRLTMVRAHLGSPIGLRAGFADVGTNGSWYPPT
jgi:hypothetical protein